MDSHILQFFDCLWTVLFDDVCYRNDSDQLIFFRKEQRRLSFCRQIFCLFQRSCIHRSLCLDKFLISTINRLSCKNCGKSVSRYCLEVFYFLRIQSALLGFLQNCMCQWVLALSFQCISKSQKFFLRDTLCRYHIRYFRFPACDGSGLVQSYDLHFTGLFQRYRRLEHDSVLCAHSVTNHNGNRCGKSQCARATDNEYGNTSCQCESNTLTCDQPYDNCNHRNRNNRRHKYPGYTVCNLCDRCFGCRRITDHLNDL